MVEKDLGGGVHIESVESMGEGAVEAGGVIHQRAPVLGQLSLEVLWSGTCFFFATVEAAVHWRICPETGRSQELNEHKGTEYDQDGNLDASCGCSPHSKAGFDLVSAGESREQSFLFCYVQHFSPLKKELFFSNAKTE